MPSISTSHGIVSVGDRIHVTALVSQRTRAGVEFDGASLRTLEVVDDGDDVVGLRARGLEVVSLAGVAAIDGDAALKWWNEEERKQLAGAVDCSFQHPHPATRGERDRLVHGHLRPAVPPSDFAAELARNEAEVAAQAEAEAAALAAIAEQATAAAQAAAQKAADADEASAQAAVDATTDGTK